jgi:hypothetical protein
MSPELDGGSGAGLARCVVSDSERYLRGGVLAPGFARVRCAACGDEPLVALSRTHANDRDGLPPRHCKLRHPRVRGNARV